jgi:hypothetical protein
VTNEAKKRFQHIRWSNIAEVKMPPEGDSPAPPPHTSDSGEGERHDGGNASVEQGDVKFEGGTNFGVQTGNVFGYHVMIGE